ncbi:hypothetical protein BJX99DRAFT_222411 [Aspergillus californicus]
MEQIRCERLSCTRETFSLLQKIETDIAPSVEELEVILGELVKTDCMNLFELEYPSLISLDDDHFPPPSPTRISNDYMLPSPVSPNFVDLDLCSRSKCIDLKSDLNKKKIPSVCCEHEGVQHRIMEPVDELRSETSKLDTSPCTIKHSPFVNLYSGASNTLHLDRTDPGISTQNDKLPLRGYVNSMTEQDTATKQSHLPGAGINSGKGSLEEGHRVAHTDNVPRPVPLRRNTTTPSGERGPTQKRCSPVPGPAKLTQSTQGGRALQPPRGNLGSLLSFMELRGKGTKRQAPAKSPYFSSSIEEQDVNITNSGTLECPKKSGTGTGKSTCTPFLPTTHIPRVSTYHGGLVLFISTALLKTHLQLIRILEGAEHPPKLIYRDYTNPSSSNFQLPKPQPKSSISTSQRINTRPPEEKEAEADIILSPKTGIILTTFQATMQLYLPGHKSIPFQANHKAKPTAINSPLREQIFNLASRYEQLYLLISHGPTPQPKRSKNANPAVMVDKRNLASFASLSAFCTSMALYGTITPLLVTSTPEHAASWVLALAHKHACRLPPPKPEFHSHYNIAFTPVNPKPQLLSSLGDIEEGIWEVFLRRAGLNPYAAQVVRAVLSRGGDDGNGVNSRGEKDAGYLSRFVEMPLEERRVLFGGILGEGMVSRVESMIEKDWQCDWALNFDSMLEERHATCCNTH